MPLRPDQRRDPETGQLVFARTKVPKEMAEAEEYLRAAGDMPELVGWEPDAPTDDGNQDPYPDWNETNSLVISGPIGHTKYKGWHAETWQQARAHARTVAQERGVRMYKFWTVPGRWFARLGRVNVPSN